EERAAEDHCSAGATRKARHMWSQPSMPGSIPPPPLLGVPPPVVTTMLFPPPSAELFGAALTVRNLAWLMLLVTRSHMWYLPAPTVTVSRTVFPTAIVGVRFGDIVSPMIASACLVVPLLATTRVTFPAGRAVVVNVTRPSDTETFSSVPSARDDPPAT